MMARKGLRDEIEERIERLEALSGATLEERLLAVRWLAAKAEDSERTASLIRSGKGWLEIIQRQVELGLKVGNDELLETASRAVALCSGSAAAGEITRHYRFGEEIVRVRQPGFQAGGLGWRVWLSAFIMSHQMLSCPELFSGKTVLELGAGCGLCGLLAARLGTAKEIVLTDYLPGLVRNLRANIQLNEEAEQRSESSRGAAQAPAGADEHDADRSGGASSAGGAGGAARRPSPLRAALLSWDADSEVAAARADEDAGGECGEYPPEPPLAAGVLAELIIGTDVVYEMVHASALPATLSARLAPKGIAWIVIGVRFPEVLAAFLEGLDAAGLRHWRTAVSAGKGATREDRAGGSSEDGSDSDGGEEGGSDTLRPPEHGQLALLCWRATDGEGPPALPPPWLEAARRGEDIPKIVGGGDNNSGKSGRR